MDFYATIVDEILRKHDADEAERDEQERKLGPALHPSSLGLCRRQAMLTSMRPFTEHPLYVDPVRDFDTHAKVTMHAGKVWEEAVADLLGFAGKPDVVASIGSWGTRYQVGSWRFETDFLLEGTTLFEFKNTSQGKFRRKDRLPYVSHCLQLLAYKQLLSRRNPGEPWHDIEECKLFYWGRGDWAEFTVESVAADFDKNEIKWCGKVNGKDRSGTFDIDVCAEMAALEEAFASGRMPDRLASPLAVPFGACVSGGESRGYRRRCRWFEHCWGDGLPEPFKAQDLEGWTPPEER